MQIAGLLQGVVDGNPDAKVSKLAKIEEGTPGSLSFLGNPKYTEYIYTTAASIVIVKKDFEPERPLQEGTTLVRVEDPHSSFAVLLDHYNQIKQKKAGIEEPSFIAESATVGENVYIGAFSYIGENSTIANNAKIYPGAYVGDNVSIGEGSVIYAGAKVYSDCIVGKDCVVHSGAVIGADGFGFAPNSANNYKKVPQIGNVILEDHVEIGALTAVDRATLGSTIVRKGVKLDNLIQVAHNVEIGENTVIAAQTGIAGSTKMGKNMMVGGQVGIIGHLNLAEEVKIAAQSGIGHNIEEKGKIVQGSPAFSIGDYKKSYVMFRKLPEIYARLSELESELKALRDKHNDE